MSFNKNKAKKKLVNYEEETKKAHNFLKNYKDQLGNTKYVSMIKAAQNRERATIEISLDDLEMFEADPQFVSRIEKNTFRYMGIFADAVDSKDMPQPDYDRLTGVEDIILRSRLMAQERIQDDADALQSNNNIPKSITRAYELLFVPRTRFKPIAIREVTSDRIGGLIQISGIVTRITEVRPMVRVATYCCEMCGAEVYQTVQGKQFTPMTECNSMQCVANKNKRPLLPMTKQSKFVKFQECKVQELPEHVPVGNIPRSITVYCMGSTTRQMTCGDKVVISGIWLPVRTSGFAAMRAGLTANTYLHACMVSRSKKGYDMRVQNPNIMREVEKAVRERGTDIYDHLGRSIAPEIFGMEDVKKALLLSLIAGVTKTQKDGVKIRGDINVLLMGDPGVAKSQLLKHVSRVAPRAVYTTGKGSSGVGLTAAVMRDPVTRDMVLEGGALVLADMGICCIDEFDKMEEDDRTAIHEVMEQQTVSIAKAGITTTLNARTCILAAANPAYGRYNKDKSPEENINLPAALLSRFDLIFVLVDRPDADNDIALARHITHVHQHDRHPDLDFEPFSSEFLRAYVAKAREYEPVVPKEITEFLVGAYVQMRQECLVDGVYDSRKIVPTPRTLLSILRLSQALARLEFCNRVKDKHIEEAIRLVKESKMSAAKDDDVRNDRRDTVSRIYDAIINFMTSRNVDQCMTADLEAVLTTKGFSEDDIQDTYAKYGNLNVWQLSRDTNKLRLVIH